MSKNTLTKVLPSNDQSLLPIIPAPNSDSIVDSSNVALSRKPSLIGLMQKVFGSSVSTASLNQVTRTNTTKNSTTNSAISIEETSTLPSDDSPTTNTNSHIGITISTSTSFPSQFTSTSNQRLSFTPAGGSKIISSRTLVSDAHDQYHIATVENEMEKVRQRNKASARLAMRLNKKKGMISDMDMNVNVNQELEELQITKAEKLKQHKLQESRHRQSMLIAKDRSTRMLQKRLEEIAINKKSQQLFFSDPRNLKLKLVDEDDEQASDEEDADCA
jgi:hypothetical protein